MSEHVFYLNHFKDVSKIFIKHNLILLLEREGSLSSYQQEMHQQMQDSLLTIFVFF